MYIQISYPIVDIRPFVEEHTSRIMVPGWDYQAQDTYGEFVRHFGHIRFANRFVQHLRQTPFCKAKAALKLPYFNSYNFLKDGPDKGPIQAPYPHRRLFVELQQKEEDPFSCEARFDFGIKISPARPSLFDIPDLVPADEGVHQLIKRFLEFPVAVGTVKGAKPYLEQCVGEIGPSLANLYLYASSQRDRREDLKTYWIKSLLPTIILQVYSKQDQAETFLAPIHPDRVMQAFSNDQFRLLQFGFKAFGKIIPVWLSIRSDRSPEARRMEQQVIWNIIRGHAEYQSIVHLAQLVSRGRLNFTPRSEASQRFQYYIDQVLKRLPSKRDDLQQQNVLFQAIAQDHYHSISVEDCLRLMKNLSHIRKNLQRKLANFSLSKDPNADVPIERLVDDRRPNPPTSINTKYLQEAEPFIKEKSLQDFEDYIRYLVTESRLEESLEILRAYLTLSNIKGDPLNSVSLQLQRYYSVSRDFNQGLIKHEKYARTKNLISKAILDFFQQISV